ncbi:MAG: AAA family ATPase, partial [Victivallales bacterium]|nr:AAA family ATPase [Victivallales bacterium]
VLADEINRTPPKTQAALLEALLADQLQDLDGRYHETLRRLSAQPPATPEKAPPGFQATLRPYQEAGLGWLRALQRQRLGGILADDMGLGKTIQVLALLYSTYSTIYVHATQTLPHRPSLVVMPSSLLFNWNAEAARFAPALRTGQFYGAGRTATPEWFAKFDVVFTTYGTLRQDFAELVRIPFLYVVLDESQAIKNADSATARAARALKAEHRLAMTGTPIENHLAELFSQLAFLNPGLFSEKFVAALGRESALLASGSDTARRLRRYTAPFILRRRKEQVASDLPAKTEQVIFCELDAPQRYYYDELRDFYRQEFSGESAANAQANMLGALLRLRQAACHAGLINPSCTAVPSAKIALLHEHLEGLLESGHKVLVFSQFTHLLKLVEQDLTASNWKYCYLDGQTKDRGEQVRQFQTDDSIGIFLISLKAGGVGLNLTAADYVYILDPWWNPAAEAQAIDRAYRIGQQRPVFAYRLIARDTVEEKVLEMQNRKKAIANAVLANGIDDIDALPPTLTAAQLRDLLMG